MRQPLARLATIEEQMRDSGAAPERRVLEFAFEKAPKDVATSLGTSQVLRVRRVNLADGEPFAIVTVWCSAELGQNLSRADVERSPFYELLDVPLAGATQTIGADAATSEEAELLKVPVALFAHNVQHRGQDRIVLTTCVSCTPNRICCGLAVRRSVDCTKWPSPRRLTNHISLFDKQEGDG